MSLLSFWCWAFSIFQHFNISIFLAIAIYCGFHFAVGISKLKTQKSIPPAQRAICSLVLFFNYA